MKRVPKSGWGHKETATSMGEGEIFVCECETITYLSPWVQRGWLPIALPLRDLSLKYSESLSVAVSEGAV